MARLVKHDAQDPVEVKVGNESKWICQCGLSHNKPYCDGTHKITRDEEEGKIYVYDEKGNRVELVKEY